MRLVPGPLVCKVVYAHATIRGIGPPRANEQVTRLWEVQGKTERLSVEFADNVVRLANLVNGRRARVHRRRSCNFGDCIAERSASTAANSFSRCRERWIDEQGGG